MITEKKDSIGPISSYSWSLHRSLGGSWRKADFVFRSCDGVAGAGRFVTMSVVTAKAADLAPTSPGPTLSGEGSSV